MLCWYLKVTECERQFVELCTFGVSGDVTLEKVLVTWETKLTVSDPLVVPVL